MSKPEFHSMPSGHCVAFRHMPGTGPTLVFLPGYMSDMSGGKATALFEWARANNRGCLLLDYSGCGQSEGEFSSGTLSKWRDEVVAVIEAVVTGRIILVGSSMGGWLMLLAAMAMPERVAGLVGIAAAPDFTDWDFTDDQKRTIADDGFFEMPLNPDYDYEPLRVYREFWNDGQAQLLLGGEIAIDCPVRLLHGQRDNDVPWAISLRLADALRSDNIQLQFVKDGDHRLSREQDLALLLRTIAAL